MSRDLAQVRTEAETELEELRRERAIATLDGTTFSRQDRIRALENRLAALDGAEGVQADRDRDAAETRRLARLAELRSELAAQTGEYFEAVDQAEMAARNLVDALGKALDASARMGKTAHAITDTAIPMGIAVTEVARRLAGRLGGLMSSIRPRSNAVTSQRFAHIVWGMTGLYQPADVWLDKEHRAIDAQIAPIIAGALPRPKERLLQIPHRKDDHVIDLNGNGGRAA